MKPGRPRLGLGKSLSIQLRKRSEARVREAARAKGLSMSSFLRQTLEEIFGDEAVVSSSSTKKILHKNLKENETRRARAS